MQNNQIYLPQNFIQDLPGFFYCKDAHLRYTSANTQYAQMLGKRDVIEIKGYTDSDLNRWASELCMQFQHDEQLIMVNKTAVTKEYKIPGINGTAAIYIRFERKPIINNDAVVGIQAYGVDITNIKTYEEVLLNEKQFIEDILYNLPGLIYWKNRDSQYMGFNRNVVELSQLSRKQLRGKSDRELNWGKDQSEAFHKDDLEVIEHGINKITEHQIPIKRRDEEYMVVRTEKSRLFNRDGDIVGVLGVALDVTDQKILEKKLLEEKEKSEKLARAKTDFICNIEHDLRTPFSGIYTISSMLLGKETDQEKQEYLKAIVVSAKELLDYCNGVIDYSRLESGSAPLIERKFDLKNMMTKIMDMESPAAVSKQIELQLDYPETYPTVVLGDDFRLRCIMINLISNAVKFTKHGFIKIKADVIQKTGEERSAVFKIMVEDSGIGIPSDKLDSIYEKFQRLTPSNKGIYRGLGLGLTSVKKFVAELEGEIDVISCLNKGTTFVVTLVMKLPLLDNFSE